MVVGGGETRGAPEQAKHNGAWLITKLAFTVDAYCSHVVERRSGQIGRTFTPHHSDTVRHRPPQRPSQLDFFYPTGEQRQD